MNFRQVLGYEGLYEVSDTGEVRGIERYVELKKGKKRLVKARTIEARVNNYGYYSVRLSKHGKTTTHFVHRLVAIAFIDNPNNLPQVNHLSGIKSDNSVGNLEWASISENTQHAYDNDLNTHKGGMHTFAVGVVDNINGLEFATIKEAAEYYSINYSTLRNTLNGYNKKPLIINLSKQLSEYSNRA